MTRAKYYIYWNLHKDCYSVRYKGKVIGHYTTILAKNVRFSVSQKGRERVLREKSKNVHAFIVADEIFTGFDAFTCYNKNSELVSVKYNPYKYSTFVDANENPVHEADAIYLSTDMKKPHLFAFFN